MKRLSGDLNSVLSNELRRATISYIETIDEGERIVNHFRAADQQAHADIAAKAMKDLVALEREYLISALVANDANVAPRIFQHKDRLLVCACTDLMSRSWQIAFVTIDELTVKP